jgi:hypothetical protein
MSHWINPILEFVIRKGYFMAKIKFRRMVIEISRTSTGKVRGNLVNAENLPRKEVVTMNKNLEMLIDLYTPEVGLYSTSTTNAIALWIPNGTRPRS